MEHKETFFIKKCKSYKILSIWRRVKKCFVPITMLTFHNDCNTEYITDRNPAPNSQRYSVIITIIYKKKFHSVKKRSDSVCEELKHLFVFLTNLLFLVFVVMLS